MNLATILEQVDARTARAFVVATRTLIDALLIESARVEQTRTPAEVDYLHAGLSREAARGGWISHAEITETTRKMSEAIAAEKWIDGVVFAARVIALLA